MQTTPDAAPKSGAEREKQVKLFDAPVTGELPPLELLDEHNLNRAIPLRAT